MDNQNFLGTGMAFPIAINPGTGRFETSSGETSVKQSIYLILMTGKGERGMRRDFGSKILSYTFGDTSGTMISLMTHDLQNAILKQEPRVKDVQITVDKEQVKDALVIDIGYTIIDSNIRDNLVFPFYLQTVKEDVPYGTMDITNP